jgi:hypothetical protein
MVLFKWHYFIAVPKTIFFKKAFFFLSFIINQEATITAFVPRQALSLPSWSLGLRGSDRFVARKKGLRPAA